MQMKKISLISLIIGLMFAFSSYGAVRTIPEVQQYADLMPTQFTEQYDGRIYIVDEIDGYPQFDGIYYHQNHDIYLTMDYPPIIIHELAHYVYYNTEWDMETATLFNTVRQGFSICGYENLDTYDYLSEIFAYMTEAYYLGTLTNQQQFEILINRILAKENT